MNQLKKMDCQQKVVFAYPKWHVFQLGKISSPKISEKARIFWGESNPLGQLGSVEKPSSGRIKQCKCIANLSDTLFRVGVINIYIP